MQKDLNLLTLLHQTTCYWLFYDIDVSQNNSCFVIAHVKFNTTQYLYSL